MATAVAAMKAMREMCRSLPDTSEVEHFGETCFCVGKRLFASCGEKKGVCRIVVQLEPEHAESLLAADPRFKPYARQRNIVWIDAATMKDFDEVRALVLESYRINAAKPSPKERGSASTRKNRPKKK